MNKRQDTQFAAWLFEDAYERICAARRAYTKRIAEQDAHAELTAGERVALRVPELLKADAEIARIAEEAGAQVAALLRMAKE